MIEKKIEQDDHDCHIIWQCNSCFRTREEHTDCNEGGICPFCGGTWMKSGESYSG
jgi:hypothetical protein